MSTHDDHDLATGERAARDAVHVLSRPRADDVFRARLREDFVTGRIGRRRGLLLRGPWFARPEVLLPFAAGVVLALVFQANRGPDWRLLAANGSGRVWMAGRAFTLADTSALSLALRRGGRVRVEGAITLDLTAPGVAAVAIGPDANLTLSAAPNRMWWRRMTVRLESGDAYFTTGQAFHGAHLDVTTPEASVRAVGTSFAVLRHSFGTCVCVMEGRVRVAGKGAPAGDGMEVPEGMRRTVGTDQSAETSPILEESVHHLHAQRSRTGGLLGR